MSRSCSTTDWSRWMPRWLRLRAWWWLRKRSWLYPDIQPPIERCAISAGCCCGVCGCSGSQIDAAAGAGEGAAVALIIALAIVLALAQREIQVALRNIQAGIAQGARQGGR